MNTKTKRSNRPDLVNWLMEALAHAGLSQAELARRIARELGEDFDRSKVQKIIGRTRKISVNELAAISKITQYPSPYGTTPPLAPRDVPDQKGHLFFRPKGDGYRVDPNRASGAVGDFFDQHMAEGREAWHLTTNLLDAGECQPGSYLVVELGTQPEPNAVVLAVTPDNVPLFRLYVGQKLIPAPLIADDTPVLDEGRDARVLGVVIACWTPGQ